LLEAASKATTQERGDAEKTRAGAPKDEYGRLGGHVPQSKTKRGAEAARLITANVTETC
jgi:hypothetical protein